MRHAACAARATTAAVLAACALSVVVCPGCEDDEYEPEPVAAPQQRPFDQPPPGGSKSSFGKARDAAVHVRQKMEERDAEIGRMADDVFKTTPSQGTPGSPAGEPAGQPGQSPE